MQTFSYNRTPPELITAACREQCPEGYPMTIKNQDDWAAIAEAFNQGIDSYLEGFTRSSADPDTGKVLIHPDEMHTLLRRLAEDSTEETCDAAMSLRVSILSTLDIEEV